MEQCILKKLDTLWNIFFKRSIERAIMRASLILMEADAIFEVANLWRLQNRLEGTLVAGNAGVFPS